ncbi:serine aminopeptidase domain-containing protein [Mariniblastus fucicola]|uniref:Alpha/beta hydrolase family protein n=1 Tax=Mariniblastus fucicola TaxID=980251 RepID=A0A5B9PGV1_9BACT|nr:alpha/beta hydrolase [Mariniblastus fucicola]QEG22141.1 Alpha/beta hydrolase family protein [Mariniblastus fucicola]
MIKQHFFGHPESPLFGVYHRPRGKAANGRSVRAAVICPSIGQEYNRTHWTLRLMANQIARKGVHVLRMDYHGIGDSAQCVDQIESLVSWHRNILQSIEHIKRESGAETVMLVGHRFGAALAAQVARQRPDVNGIVMWEPVLCGRSYLDSLRKMHESMLDLWVCKMSTPNDDSIEEILGSRYQRCLLEQIEAMKIELADVIQPQLIADQRSKAKSYSHPEPGTQLIIEDPRPGSWNDLNELELAWLRPKVMRQIVKKIDDMFSRLDRFGALRLCMETIR